MFAGDSGWAGWGGIQERKELGLRRRDREPCDARAIPYPLKKRQQCILTVQDNESRGDVSYGAFLSCILAGGKYTWHKISKTKHTCICNVCTHREYK